MPTATGLDSTTNERSVPNGIRNSDENDDVFITNTHTHTEHTLTPPHWKWFSFRAAAQEGTTSNEIRVRLWQRQRHINGSAAAVPMGKIRRALPLSWHIRSLFRSTAQRTTRTVMWCGFKSTRAQLDCVNSRAFELRLGLSYEFNFNFSPDRYLYCFSSSQTESYWS